MVIALQETKHRATNRVETNRSNQSLEKFSETPRVPLRKTPIKKRKIENTEHHQASSQVLIPNVEKDAASSSNGPNATIAKPMPPLLPKPSFPESKNSIPILIDTTITEIIGRDKATTHQNPVNFQSKPFSRAAETLSDNWSLENEVLTSDENNLLEADDEQDSELSNAIDLSGSDQDVNVDDSPKKVADWLQDYKQESPLNLKMVRAKGGGRENFTETQDFAELGDPGATSVIGSGNPGSPVPSTLIMS